MRSIVSLLCAAILLVGTCAAASFYPTSLSTTSGLVPDTPITALNTLDQVGDQDDYSKYVEFRHGSAPKYSGIFSFTVGSVTASAYALNVNYRGPLNSYQVWTFEWYIPSTNTFVFAGDNTNALDWSWKLLAFPGVPPFSSLVSSNGVVQLRYSASNRKDDSDLDFLQLNVITNSNPTTAAPTQAPTQAPTSRPTSAPTQAPTSRPTSAPTQAPTSRPTAAPTQQPTNKPTAPPTQAPTQPPTQAPTKAPTNAPTVTPGGKKCPAGTHYQPGPYTTWQWQLSGTVDTSFDVQLYDIDMFGATASLISQLQSQGRAVICYIDTAYEPGRPDSNQFTSAVLGSGIDGWPGQKWVDIRSSVVRGIMQSRIALAASKGCDGVEMDDVDAYQNNPGFPLTAQDQINFNTFLATTAHSYGLGIGLKNDLDQVSALVNSFDFAINEQCYQYNECADLTKFISQNKAVFGVEYNIATTAFCPQANAARFSWLKKGLDLDANPRTQCCTSNCGGTYSCVPN